MSLQSRAAVLGAGLILSLISGPALADELAEKGRAVFEKNQHAVVTVQIVIKTRFSMGGQGSQANESRHELTGTVLAPSGLTVLSLSATDPAQMVQSLIAGMANEDSRFKMESELGEVKILLEDGTEVPAEVVLRDKDLDLAFIRPKAKPAAPMTALDFSQAAKVGLLDQLIAINRLSHAAGRAYAASLDRIAAIVERPRRYYVPESSMGAGSLGCPAFTLEGRPVGVYVVRSLKARSGEGLTSLFSVQPANFTGIIVPADDILKAAKQVPAAAEEKEKK